MRSILEELFYGNVCPNTDCRSRDKEVKDLMAHIADHHSNLNETLTDKQKELFEKFDNAWDELNDINEREIFVYCSPFLWERSRIYALSRNARRLSSSQGFRQGRGLFSNAGDRSGQNRRSQT